MVPTIAGRAPAKIILIGEHFVVLGAPALAMAVNLYSTARASRNETGKVEVEATLPLRLVDSGESRAVKSEELLKPLRMAAEVVLDRVHGNTRGVHVQVECNIPIGAGLGSSASTSVAIIAAVAKSQGVQLGKKEIFRLAYKPETLIHNKPSGVDQATTTYGGVGCMIALCKGNKSKQRIARRLRRMGGTVYNTSLAVRGVEVLGDS